MYEKIDFNLITFIIAPKYSRRKFLNRIEIESLRNSAEGVTKIFLLPFKRVYSTISRTVAQTSFFQFYFFLFYSMKQTVCICLIRLERQMRV